MKKIAIYLQTVGKFIFQVFGVFFREHVDGIEVHYVGWFEIWQRDIIREEIEKSIKKIDHRIRSKSLALRRPRGANGKFL